LEKNNPYFHELKRPIPFMGTGLLFIFKDWPGIENVYL